MLTISDTLRSDQSLSRVRLLATPWTVAHQAPPSMGFSRQECWSGMPLPSPLCYYMMSLLFFLSKLIKIYFKMPFSFKF